MKNIFNEIVEDRDAFLTAVTNALKELGIKVPKNIKTTGNNAKYEKSTNNLFHCYLSQLSCVSVCHHGINLEVPSFLVMALGVIRENIEAEGLFRKGGSIHRQKDLKRTIEIGGDIHGANVHDVANLVKQFLRYMAEPLIPSRLQVAFVKGYELDGIASRKEALLLLCALLPKEHLHTLFYLMTFFYEVASHSTQNKMDSKNLAVVITPNVFISSRELDQKEKYQGKFLHKQTGVVQFLIENSQEIGMVSDQLIDVSNPVPDLLTQSEDELDGTKEVGRQVKKSTRVKRTSLNGMLQGLIKMVQPNRVPLASTIIAGDSPILDRTPSQAIKRRHGDVPEEPDQCSSAKKRAIMQTKTDKLKPNSLLHMDSPDPIHREDQVSSSPSTGSLFINGSSLPKRKSGRMKFFGTTYLRKSVITTPKTNKKTTKTATNGVIKNKSDDQLGRHPSVDSSPPNLASDSHGHWQSVLTVAAIAKRINKLTPDAKRASATELKMERLRQSQRNLERVGQTNCELKTGGQLQKVQSKPSFGSDVFLNLRSGRCFESNKQIDVGIEGVKALRSLRRSQSNRLPSTPSNDPAFEKPAVKSSLRRGRPNTIRTGLLPPLKMPTEKTENCVGTPTRVLPHYVSDPGPIVQGTWQVISPELLFGAPSSPKVSKQCVANEMDTGNSTKCKESQPLSDSDEIIASIKTRLVFDSDDQEEKRSVDFGSSHPALLEDSAPLDELDKKLEDVFEEHHFVSEPENVSSSREEVPREMEKPVGVTVSCLDTQLTANEQQPSPSQPLPESTVPLQRIRSKLGLDSDSELLLSSDKYDTVKFSAQNEEWRPAKDVLQVGTNHCDDQGNLGRPSLIRLMKDKAGSVSATARKYDAIATAVKMHVTPQHLSTVANVVVQQRRSPRLAVTSCNSLATPEVTPVANGGLPGKRVTEGRVKNRDPAGGSNLDLHGATVTKKLMEATSRSRMALITKRTTADPTTKQNCKTSNGNLVIATQPKIASHTAIVGKPDPKSANRTKTVKAPSGARSPVVIRRSPRLTTQKVKVRANGEHSKRNGVMKRRSTSL